MDSGSDNNFIGGDPHSRSKGVTSIDNDARHSRNGFQALLIR
jgi:hypothetical protein